MNHPLEIGSSCRRLTPRGTLVFGEVLKVMDRYHLKKSTAHKKAGWWYIALNDTQDYFELHQDSLHE